MAISHTPGKPSGQVESGSARRTPWTPRWPPCREQVLVTWITPAGQGECLRTAASKLRKERLGEDLAVSQASSPMIDAGLPLVQCLDILGTRRKTGTLRLSSCADAVR